MSPDSLTATAPAETPALRPAPGRTTPLPEWVSTTDRNALPNILNWASEAARPPINCRVDLVRFGIALGTGTVTGYFHKDGELGCWVDLDSPSNGNTRTHFFGESITRLDQGDEQLDTADRAGVQDVPAAPRAELPLLSTQEEPEPMAEVPQEAAVQELHGNDDEDQPFGH